MLSFAISGPVAQAYGWRVAMAVAAAPAVLLVPVLLSLPEPERAGGKAPRRRDRGAVGCSRHSGAVVDRDFRSGAEFRDVQLLDVCVRISHALPRTLGAQTRASGRGSDRARPASSVRWRQAIFGDRVNRMLLIGRRRPGGRAAGLSRRSDCLPDSTAVAILLLMIAYGLLQMYYGPVYAAIQDIVRAGAAGNRDGRVLPGDVSLRRRAGPAAHRPVERSFRAGGLPVRECSARRRRAPSACTRRCT